MATVFGVIVYGGIETIFMPISHQMDQPMSGTVTGFSLAEDWDGSSRGAIVRLADGRSAIVGVAKQTRCRVGSRITVAKRRTWWGHVYLTGYRRDRNP